MRRGLLAPVIVLALTLGAVAPLGASTIRFRATDLPDVPGGDLWQYEYFVDGSDFLASQGFAVFFDGDLYSTLQALPPALPGEWDGPVVADPDLVLDSDGYYDALALVSDPSFAGPFTVGFIWLGGAGKKPGSQPFQIYQLDGQGTPVPLERGVTVPFDGAAAPEPSTLLLAAVAAAAATERAVRERRRQLRRSNTPRSPSSKIAETHRLE